MIDPVGRGSGLRPAMAGEAGAKAPVKAAEGAATGATAAPAAATRGAAVRALAAAPPVDAARVAALRTAIASGAYKPDPDAIAARMIALESVPGKQ